MKNSNSKLKKAINTSKSQQQIGRKEDPFVCSICGSNNLTFLDSEEDEVYCFECNSRRTLLDLEKIPEQTLVKTLSYWKDRFEEWKEGADLSQQDLKELQETIYSAEHFSNSEKKRELLKISEEMGVEVNEK